jgi:hypothetical protein
LEDNSDRDEQSKRRLQGTLPSSITVSSGSGNNNTVALFHTTPPQERAVAIILGVGALSATFYAASSAVKAYKETSNPTLGANSQMKAVL